LSDAAQLLVWPPLALLIALPALAAWRRRDYSREMRELADALVTHAEGLQAGGELTPLAPILLRRLDRLGIPETVVLKLAQDQAAQRALRADCAQRLALRLRRRVAFERKMLARAAPGLRRGAFAASAPPLVALVLQFVGIEIPLGARAALVVVEILGCVLLWRLARVEI
jgi:hypothetical protein